MTVTQDPPSVLEKMSPAVLSYSHYLKDLYKRREGMSLQWPKVLMKDFVNLYCIESEKKQDEKALEQMVCGQIDELQQSMTPIDITDIAAVKDGVFPSCILVQGAPGSGKTMFSWEVSRRWGHGSLLEHYPLLVMLPLRDTDVQNASDLADLFPHHNKTVQQEVVAAVEEVAGKGVLLLLDGFDELPMSKQKPCSLLMKVITGKLLRLATVIVTSRPWAIKTLQEPSHYPRISQHIEIVGFTKSNINEYVTKAFPNAAEQADFQAYLNSYPHIRSTMYIPLNCAIVVEIYRMTQSTYPTPKTVTQTYIALVKALLFRYIQRHPRGPQLAISQHVTGKIRKKFIFTDLPFNVYQQLRIISKLAYRGLRNNQQLIFSDIPANFETLDLLQRAPQFHNDRRTSVTYNFLHLTVQEFLAAFYILLRGRKKQKKCIKGRLTFGPSNTLTKREGSAEVVCKFLAGLGGYIKALRAPIIDNKAIKLLSCLFESQNASLTCTLFGNKNSTRAVHLDYHVSPQDMYVLGYCISQSNCQWQLEFYGLSDEHLAMMKRGLASWGEHKARITSFRANFSGLTCDGLSHLLSLPHNSLNELTYLDLSENKLDSESCTTLSHNFTSLPHLQKLDLRYNSICAGGHLMLIRAIPTADSLQEVVFSELSPDECRLLISQGYVSRIRLRELSEESVEVLAVFLNSHATLSVLEIIFSHFSSRNISSFSSSLAVNCTLQVLSLKHNNINCNGVQLLSQALCINSTLKELDLSGNESIKEIGGYSLARTLRVNQSLKFLDIRGTSLSEETTRQLLESLRDNHTLNSLYLPDEWTTLTQHLPRYQEIKSRLKF